MNWNQIRQRLEGTRSWNAAPSSFVRALKEMLARRSTSRRTGIAACGKVESLEIRQVLSAASPAPQLNFAALNFADDLNDASGSGADLQSQQNMSDAEQHKLIAQTNTLNSYSLVTGTDYVVIRNGLLFDLTSASIRLEVNNKSDDYSSYPGINYGNSSSLAVTNTQLPGTKSSSSESHPLTNSDLGQTISQDNETALIDAVFQRSDSILDSSPSNASPTSSSSPTSSNKPPVESNSLPTSAVTQQNSNSAPTTIVPQTLKQETVVRGSEFVVWQDAASNEISTNFERHSNPQSRSLSTLVRNFVVRSTKGNTSTDLRLLAEFHTGQSSSVSPETDSANSDLSPKFKGRSWRSVLSNIEEFYASIDLFNSPLDSFNIADTVSQFTLSFIADGTLPFAVPQLTPETAPSYSMQHMQNMTPVRAKHLRDGHRQHQPTAVISTDIVQHDGTPELAESKNIPRQLKHVVLPRGPPRKQPDTVLRIMDSDAEAHVLQRLRYSIAPRGPSIVTVEMQSPEECSFSGPRVNSEETCHVQLAC